MGEMNGIPGMPDGPPPGAPGSPEALGAPIPPVPPIATAAPQMPDFGPSTAPEAPTMSGVSRAAMGLWFVLLAVILVVGIFVAAQVFRGFGEFGLPGGGSCTFDHDPSDAELEACLDDGS